MVSVLWGFNQVLICSQCLLLDLILFSQVAEFSIISLDAFTSFLGTLIGVLVLQVQSASQALEIALRIYQVFNTHLTQPEQLHEQVGESLVTKAFHIRSI